MLFKISRKMTKPLIIIVIILFLANTFASFVNTIPKNQTPPPPTYSYQDNFAGLKHLPRQP